jgi:hypothetical protein
MSVGVWERERTWVIDKNCVAKSHITVKIITELNRSKSAQTSFSGKPRIYPPYPPNQSRLTRLIGGYGCFNRRNFPPEHEFQSIPAHVVKNAGLGIPFRSPRQRCSFVWIQTYASVTNKQGKRLLRNKSKAVQIPAVNLHPKERMNLLDRRRISRFLRDE